MDMEIVFQVYATSSHSRYLSQRPAYIPPQLVPPYEFESLGELTLRVSPNLTLDSVHIIEFLPESGFGARNLDSLVKVGLVLVKREDLAQNGEKGIENAHIFRFQQAANEHPLIQKCEVLLKIIEEHSFLILSYQIDGNTDVYWLQGISPLGEHQLHPLIER